MVALQASDGHQSSAYESHPEDAPAVVVVLQEIFGVNPHIRAVVDRYAALRYRSIAQAPFDRAEPGSTELAYTADGVARGRQLRQRLNWDESVLDVAAAVQHVSVPGPVAVVGCCYGGSMAWLAASSLPVAAAVCYYGAQIPSEFADRRPAAPTMLHFGEMDTGIGLDGVKAVADPSYNPGAATLAQQRTNEFLSEHLHP